MADYASRIASLTAEQALLAQRQSALAAQRREEIGKLVDRRGLVSGPSRRVRLFPSPRYPRTRYTIGFRCLAMQTLGAGAHRRGRDTYCASRR